MILDSNFLIHLERERRRQEKGPASQFLLTHADASLAITPTIAGEIACGNSMRDRKSWAKYLSFFTCLEITHEVSWHYGEVFRHLKENGKMIGQNDLWIAATALAHNRPIVTRNVSEFSRVPSLEVREF